MKHTNYFAHEENVYEQKKNGAEIHPTESKVSSFSI